MAEHRNSKQRLHAGEGRFVSNMIQFVLLFAAFLVGLYLMGFIEHYNPATWWAMPVAILLCTLAYLIPQALPTRKEHAGK